METNGPQDDLATTERPRRSRFVMIPIAPDVKGRFSDELRRHSNEAAMSPIGSTHLLGQLDTCAPRQSPNLLSVHSAKSTRTTELYTSDRHIHRLSLVCPPLKALRPALMQPRQEIRPLRGNPSEPASLGRAAEGSGSPLTQPSRKTLFAEKRCRKTLGLGRRKSQKHARGQS